MNRHYSESGVPTRPCSDVIAEHWRTRPVLRLTLYASWVSARSPGVGGGLVTAFLDNLRAYLLMGNGGRSSGTVERGGRPAGSGRRYPVSSGVPHLSVAERVARGKAARAEVPRSSHAVFEPAAHRLDPIELLERQADARVPELVPIRYGRMLVSPFTFYRGAALIMASDLAATPRSGLLAQCCGDAHLSNFGLYASPERRLVFAHAHRAWTSRLTGYQFCEVLSVW